MKAPLLHLTALNSTLIHCNFSIALFLEVTVFYNSHFHFLWNIINFPEDLELLDRAFLLSHPHQVVMKSDHAAIHRNKSVSEMKRGRKKKPTEVSPEKTWKVSEADSTCASFHKENQSLNSVPPTPHHLFLCVFFKGRYI